MLTPRTNTPFLYPTSERGAWGLAGSEADVEREMARAGRARPASPIGGPPYLAFLAERPMPDGQPDQFLPSRSSHLADVGGGWTPSAHVRLSNSRLKHRVDVRNVTFPEARAPEAPPAPVPVAIAAVRRQPGRRPPRAARARSPVRRRRRGAGADRALATARPPSCGSRRARAPPVGDTWASTCPTLADGQRGRRDRLRPRDGQAAPGADERARARPPAALPP